MVSNHYHFLQVTFAPGMIDEEKQGKIRNIGMAGQVWGSGWSKESCLMTEGRAA